LEETVDRTPDNPKSETFAITISDGFKEVNNTFGLFYKKKEERRKKMRRERSKGK
jgi:hypothetical protein